MKILNFEEYIELAAHISFSYDYLINKECKDVSIVAKYDDARHIIGELVRLGYNLYSVSELSDCMYSDYDKEFIISLCNASGEDEIWCEPMFRVKDNDYIKSCEADIFYIMGDCSHKVLSHCIGDVLYEVSLDDDYYDDDDCDCDCEECCNKCYEDDNGINNDMHSFSVSCCDDDGYCYYTFSASDAELLDRIANKYLKLGNKTDILLP